MKIKKVTVTLHRLTDKDLKDANSYCMICSPMPSSGFTKFIKKSSRQAKDIYTPAKLHKDTSGVIPRFTFSTTYKLTRKRKCRYKFTCTVESCAKSFSSIKEWNIHHLFKHRLIKYKCNQCGRWL